MTGLPGAGRRQNGAVPEPTSPPDADDAPLPAGDFDEWLAGMRRALDGSGDSDVPCNGCTACCESSLFVHVEPDELDAIAHIPAELLVPAPGLPEGYLVMGHDERGRCPMLGEGGCTIHAHRPRTCRVFDCRIFPATGVDPEPQQVAITRRARRWRFDYSGPAAEQAQAVLREVAASITSDTITPTRRAVMAVEASEPI